MASSSLPGVLVFATAISGVVGGVVGGLIVLAGASLSGPAAAPADAAPIASPQGESAMDPELLIEDPQPQVELPLVDDTPPGPLDPSPAAERPPFALGFVVPADASDFVRQQVEEAREGEVDSMLRVADWLAEGAGLPKSIPLANTWFRRARSQCVGSPGDADVQSVVRVYAAFLADAGAGAWANPEAAVALLEESARADPAAAGVHLDLAELIERGQGTPADPERARRMVLEVAERLLQRGKQGGVEGRAFFLLARYLHDGVGGGADPREAAIWARRGIEGQPPYLVTEGEVLTAIDYVRELDEVPGGVLWLRHYTEKQAAAAFFLGQCHEQGRHGVEPDLKQALAYYRRAAKLEHAHAAGAVERLATLEVEASGE